MALAGPEREGLNNAPVSGFQSYSNNEVGVKVEGSTLEIEVWSRRAGGKYAYSRPLSYLLLIATIGGGCSVIAFGNSGPSWVSIVLGIVCFLSAYIQMCLIFNQSNTRNVLRVGEQQYEYNPAVPYTVCGRCSPFIHAICLVWMVKLGSVGPTADLKSATVLLQTDDSRLPLPLQGLKIERHDNTSFQIFLSLFKNDDKTMVRDAINTHLELLASRRSNNSGGAYAGHASPNPVTMQYNERAVRGATVSPKDTGFGDEDVRINMPLIR